MTTTIVRPTSFEVVNYGLPSDIVVTGDGNVLNDGLDTTYVTTVTRPGQGETKAPFVRLRFEDAMIPVTETITNIFLRVRARVPSNGSSGVNWAPIDKGELYDDDSSNYSYISFYGATISDYGSSYYDTTYSYRQFVQRNLSAGLLEIAITGENYWNYRSYLQITEVWLEVVHTTATTPLPGPGQPNDNFADRIELIGTSGSVGFDLTGLTFEPGEPRLHGDYGYSSLWYKWTCPLDFTPGATLRLTADDPLLPADAGPTMMLWVYTGEITTGLTPVAVGSTQVVRIPGYTYDSWSNQASLYFQPVPGETYAIAVVSYNETTTGTLAWAPGPPPPVNDNLENAVALTLDGPSTPVNLVAASLQHLEPEWDWAPSTVWYKYTTPANSPSKFILNLTAQAGTEAEVEVYVYDGQYYGFSEWNWDGAYTWAYVDPDRSPTEVTVSCVPSRTYYFQVIGESVSALSTPGVVSIGIKSPPPPPPPPPNNTLDTAADIDYAGTGQPEVELAGASSEPGETVPWGSPMRTAWYTWTTPAALVGKPQEFKATVKSYSGGSPYIGMSVYTGDGPVTSLVRKTSNTGYAEVTLNYTPTVAGQKLKIQIWDYYATSDSMKVYTTFPRGGKLKVDLDGDPENFADICKCPDTYDFTDSVTQTVTYGQTPSDYPDARPWPRSSLETGSTLLPAGYNPAPGEPATTAALTTPPNYTYTETWDYPEAIATTGKPLVFYTTGLTAPTGAGAQFPVNRKQTGDLLSKVTIRALVESVQGVYITLTTPTFAESSGIGGKFTSPNGWSWVEQTFYVTDRSVDERKSWASALKAVNSLYVVAWQRPNTGGHAVAKVYVTLETQSFKETTTGRLKLKAPDPSGAVPEGVWYVEKCCKHTQNGRPLKIKAGENDWRKAVCLIREPTDWVQLPDQEYVWNPMQQRMINSGISNNVVTPTNPFYTPNEYPTVSFASYLYDYLGGFHGSKEMWRSAGGNPVDEDIYAVRCAWNGARRGQLGAQWWSDGGYEQNGTTYVCYLTEGIFGGGFSHQYNDMPVGYAGTWAAGTFGAGFGDDAGARIFTVMQEITVNHFETADYFARPKRLVPAPPPGASIEWEGGAPSTSSSEYIAAVPRGQLISLHVAPDGNPNQTATYPHGPLPPVRWGAHVGMTAAQRNTYGWGYASVPSGYDSGYGSGWYGGAPPTNFLNSLHTICDWNGGPSPWYEIPQALWQKAKEFELSYQYSTNDGGLLLHGYTPYMLSEDLPPGMWPVDNNYSYMYRHFCHMALKWVVRPQRYRYVYPY